MPSVEQRIRKLLGRGTTVRSRELVDAGVTRSELSRLVAAGKVLRVARGLYAAPGYQSGEHGALVAVAKRAPRTLFRLLTALANEGAPDAAQLAQALAATFERRGTPLPEATPLGLRDEFATDAIKIAQWKAFLGKNRLDAPELTEVAAKIRDFLAEPLRVAHKQGKASN